MSKTNSRHFRFICDEFDLSGDTRQVGDFGVTHDEEDVTGWSNGRKNVTLGHAAADINGYQAVFATDEIKRSFDALKEPEERIITLALGIGAAPVVGNPSFMVVSEQASFAVDGSGPVIISANLPKSVSHLNQTANFGHLLATGAALSATTNGTAVDNGAATTAGAFAYLHVTETSAGNWSLKVQHSADNSVWVDLITFTANGSTLTAEVGQAAGTINRYLRFQATRTAGTSRFWCSVVRL